MWSTFPFSGNTSGFCQQLKSYQTITFHCGWPGREAGTQLCDRQRKMNLDQSSVHVRKCSLMSPSSALSDIKYNKSLLWISKPELQHLPQREYSDIQKLIHCWANSEFSPSCLTGFLDLRVLIKSEILLHAHHLIFQAVTYNITATEYIPLHLPLFRGVNSVLEPFSI